MTYSMADASANRTGLKVVSLFAGAGGSSLGYRLAGFDVAWANEFVPEAAAVYAVNKSPATVLDSRDIRAIDPVEILAATNLNPGELDLLDGSPPCSSFSTIGRLASEWGKPHRYGVSDNVMRTDDLFFEYVRVLRELKPRAFVAENVTGLVKGVAKGYFKIVMSELEKSGYRVEARILNAAWLGVPQNRQRLVFVGVRKDLGSHPVYPSPWSKQTTMEQVFPYITRVGTAPALKEFLADPTCAFASPDRPCPTIVTLVNEGAGLCITRNTGGSGRGAKGHPDDVDRDPETDFPLTYTLRDLHRGKARRIVAMGGTSAGFRQTPGGVRRYSLVELRTIFSYPRDFLLVGTYGQRWERLARSVPPLMMKAVASGLRDKVLT